MHLLFLAVLALLVTAAYAGYKGAPWVPTRTKDIHQVIDELRDRKITSAIDLGCGTGSLLFSLAQEKPDTILHGYDISLGPLFFGWIRKYLSPKKYKNVHLQWKNLYSVDVSFADVIFVFMMPKPHTRIAKTVLSHTQPHATILFEAWPPEGFTPMYSKQGIGCLPLYIYQGKTFHNINNT